MSDMKKALCEIGLVVVSDVTITTEQFNYFTSADEAKTRTILAFCPGYQIGFVIRHEFCRREHVPRDNRDYWACQVYANFEPRAELAAFISNTVPDGCYYSGICNLDGSFNWCIENTNFKKADILSLVKNTMNKLMPRVLNGKLYELTAAMCSPRCFPESQNYYVQQLNIPAIKEFVYRVDTKYRTPNRWE